MSDPIPQGRQSIGDADVEAVTTVLRSDYLTTGPMVGKFESRLAEVTGKRCVSVTSGTAALHVAYGALEFRPGDEVITTPITFASTATAAMLAGATVVFADVSEDTANLDPAAVAALVGPRTRAVAGIDYGGHPMDADGLRAVSGGAVLIQDAAHSLGGRDQGRPVGSVADLTTLSFYPTKNMTTAEGGAVAVARDDLFEPVRRFARIGRTVDEPAAWRNEPDGDWWYEIASLGLNYRLPDVLCALGISQLDRLDAFVARRVQLVGRYDELLADVEGLQLPVQRDGVQPVRHLYPVRVLGGRRKELFDGLRERGIKAQVNYIPVYWHPVFADLGYRRGTCPVAEEFYAEQLSLPLYVDLSDDDQDRVVEAVREVLTT